MVFLIVAVLNRFYRISTGRIYVFIQSQWPLNICTTHFQCILISILYQIGMFGTKEFVTFSRMVVACCSFHEKNILMQDGIEADIHASYVSKCVAKPIEVDTKSKNIFGLGIRSKVNWVQKTNIPFCAIS